MIRVKADRSLTVSTSMQSHITVHGSAQAPGTPRPWATHCHGCFIIKSGQDARAPGKERTRNETFYP